MFLNVFIVKFLLVLDMLVIIIIFNKIIFFYFLFWIFLGIKSGVLNLFMN